MTPKQEAWAIQAEHVIKQMERRHFNAYYCSTKEEALTKALSIIEKGSVIASGGSATLGEVGLLDYIKNHSEDYTFIDRSIAKTEDENVADISAMRCVLDIMNTIENADYKSFFNSFASSFVGGATRKYLAYLISEDEHANYGVRVNTVLSNFQEFYDTYGISEGDAMYVKPENRITIW